MSKIKVQEVVSLARSHQSLANENAALKARLAAPPAAPAPAPAAPPPAAAPPPQKTWRDVTTQEIDQTYPTSDKRNVLQNVVAKSFSAQARLRAAK
jgi:hypothetical protein